MDKKVLHQLIRRTSKGDMTALEQLYNDLRNPIFAFVLSILNHQSNAEDITQETFISIAKKAHQYNGTNSISWIYTIARNLCLDLFKKSGKELLIDSDNAPQKMFSEYDFALNSDDKISILNALNILNKTEQEIVILYIVAGLKHREISQVTKIPLGTVLWKYNSAIKKLKTQLKGAES